jgi:hypothetical protein
MAMDPILAPGSRPAVDVSAYLNFNDTFSSSTRPAAHLNHCQVCGYKQGMSFRMQPATDNEQHSQAHNLYSAPPVTYHVGVTTLLPVPAYGFGPLFGVPQQTRT